MLCEDRLRVLLRNSLEVIQELVGDDDAFDFLSNNIGITLEEYQNIISD